MAIDDLLEEAVHIKHGREGANLQQDIQNLHIMLLEKFYKQGLSAADRSAFEALPEEQRIAKFRENNYKLKPEQTEQLVRYLSVVILKRHDSTMGSQLEQALKTIYEDPSATQAQKLRASEQVNHHRVILQSLGFNAFEMEREAMERGFSPEIWEQFTRTIAQGYVAKKQQAATGLISRTQAREYLASTVTPATGIKADVVAGKEWQEVISVLLGFKRYQKQGDLEGFKQQYHHYHT